ncbi:MAG: lysylphosphatidylglycerol synthase transmembrane domain-containing protein [Pseudomonadota bacterium]
MSRGKENGQRLKRNLLIVVGTLLGMFFLYLAFRDVSWSDLMAGIREMHPMYLVPCAILMVLVQLVRALRFGVILSPFCALSVKSLWDILNIWGAANMVMPARLAEFVRPYLLQRRGASFSSTFGAVLVERFFDLTGLLLLLAVVLWKTPKIPQMYSYVGLILLAALASGYVMVLLILTRRETVEALMAAILSLLPRRAGEFIGGILQRLIEGFGVMASFRRALIIFSYSILLWILFSVMTYLFLQAFSIKAPFLVAVTIQVLICFGVALPSAPGFIGTFHAAGRYALALFGVHAVAAVSFATVYHLFSLLASLLLGFVSYVTSDFRFDRSVIVGSLDTAERKAAEGVKCG